MNRIFRTLWSATRQCWQAVPENTKAASKGSSKTASGASSAGGVASVILGFMFTGSVGAQSPPSVKTLPTGGVIAQGSVTISQTATAQAAAMMVNQSSQRAVVNWNTFNLGSAASVNFAQPNAQAVTLNRVSDANPSQIYGRITAPGQVFLSNPNGVYFSPTSQVDVGALTATTLSISDANFMAGNYRFERNGATGKVVNEGNINAALGGYVALLAPEVQNAGLVVAQAGNVAMAAGELITLNLNGVGGLASITTTPSTIASLVENKHAVLAPDGQIVLSAVALNKLQAGVVKNSGSLEANSLVNKGGKIVLEGDDITLNRNSKIEAKGPTGGGTVLVGGDWQGSGEMRQATIVTMEAGATIDASATDKGDGGKVVLWSDIHKANSVTRANGSIKAEAGPNGGDGGKVETSGHYLNVDDIQVSTQSTKGNAGEWLLDPYDITIGGTTSGTAFNDTNPGDDSYTAAATSNINASVINTALTNGNVTVSTGAVGSAGTGGNINISNGISWTSDKTLTLIAAKYISGSGAISIGTNGGLTMNVGTTGSTYFYSGAITGAGNFTKEGLGNLILTSTGNTYTGTTTINGGTLEIGTGNQSIGSLGTGDVINNAALKIWRGGTYSLSNNFSGAGTFNYQGSTSGVTNALTLSGNNSFTGGITLAGGTVFLGSATAIGTSGNITFANGRLGFSASNTTDYSSRFLMTGNPSISIDTGGQTVTLATAMTNGTGFFYKYGAGTLILPANSTYTGRTTIYEGTLQLGNGGAGGALSTSTIDTAGTVVFNRSGSYSISYTIRDLSGVTLTAGTAKFMQSSSSDTITLLNRAQGLTNLIQDGPGTLILTDANSYTGQTTINAGTLQVGNAGSTGQLGTGAVTNNGILTFKLTSSLTASNNISGSGELIKDSSGGLTLTGVSSYTGNTTLSNGSLILGSSGALGNTSSIIFNGGVLQFSASNTNDYSAVFSNTANQAYKIDTNGQTVNLASALTSAGGSLAKSGLGTLILGGNNTFTGAVSVTGGSLRAASDNALGSTAGGVTVSSGATLELGGPASPGGLAIGAEALTVNDGGAVRNVAGFNTYAGTISLVGNATITVDTGTTLNFTASGAPAVAVAANKRLTLNLANGDLTFAKALSGSTGSSYLKTGSGTLTTGGISGLTLVTGVYARLYDPTGNDYSTEYGATPDYTYAFFDSATGGNKVTFTGFSGAPTWTGTKPILGSAAAAYSLTYASGLTVSNIAYALMAGGGATTWTVTPKPITITLTPPAATYNGVTTYTNLVNGTTYANTAMVGTDALASITKTATLVGGGAANGVAQGGAYVITPSLAVMKTGTASNYNFIYSAANGTVLKAPLTMTANDASILLGQGDPAFTARYTGFVNGETAAVLTTPTVTRFGADAAAGTYAGVLRPSATSNNYNIATVNGTFTIVPADTLLVKVSDLNKTYGAAPNYAVTSAEYLTAGNVVRTVNVTATGGGHFTYTDGLIPTPTTGSFDLSSAATANSDVNNYAITLSNFTKVGNNFTVATPSVQSGNLAVVPLAATLSPTLTVSRTYDGTTAATGAVSITNKVGTDDVSVSGTGEYTDNANAGIAHTYSVTGLTVSGAKASNYSIDPANLPALTGNNGVINPAALTLSTSNVVKTYDGSLSVAGATTAPALTVTAGTLYANASNGGVTDSVSGGTFTFTNANAGVGNKAVTVSNATVTDGNGGANYTVSYANNITSTINPAALTLSTSNVVKTYDGSLSVAGATTAPALTVTSGTLYANASNGGATDAVTGGNFAFTDANAGTSNKTVTVSGATFSTGSANNYTVSYANNITSTINPAALTLSTSNVVKAYDGTLSVAGATTAPALTVTSGTLYSNASNGGATDAVTGGNFAFTDANAGTGNKTVTVAGATFSTGNANNYTISYANNNTSTINAATPTLTGLSNQNKTVGAANFTLAASSNSVGAVTYTSSDPTVATVNPATGEVTVVAAGNATITAAQVANGNYALGNATYTLTVSAAIQPAPIEQPPVIIPPVVTPPVVEPAVVTMPLPVLTVQAPVIVVEPSNTNMPAIPTVASSAESLDLTEMTTRQIALIPVQQVRQLSSAQIESMSGIQVRTLSPQQLGVMSSDQVAAFRPPQLQAMTTTQVASFAPEQLVNLQPDQIAAFSVTQLRAMTPLQAQTLTPTQLSSLNVAQLAAVAVDTITIPSPETTLATATQSSGVLPITVLDGGSATRATGAGVAFEQGPNSITLRSLDTPPAVITPSSDMLAFNDKLTTFMVTSNVGELVEFQGSLIGNRLVIIAPTNSARQVARAEMKLVLAAAITTLGREQRVMLADLQGVVFDLR